MHILVRAQSLRLHLTSESQDDSTLFHLDGTIIDLVVRMQDDIVMQALIFIIGDRIPSGWLRENSSIYVLYKDSHFQVLETIGAVKSE